MNTAEIQRRITIAYYSLCIWTLRVLMRLEDAHPISDEWKQLACRQGWYIQQRNKLRTPAEVAKIEKRRGLS